MPWSYAAWVAWVDHRRRWILVGSAIVCLVSALSLRRLRFDFDVLSMLPRGTPAFDDFASFIAEFGQLNELVVLIDGAPIGQLRDFADAFAARVAERETVGDVQARIDVAQVFDGVLGRYVYNYLPEEAYADLAARLTPEGLDAQAAIDRAILSAPFDLATAGAVLRDPFALRRLVGAELAKSAAGEAFGLSDGYLAASDGSALLMLIRPRASAFDIQFSEKLMRDIGGAELEARRAQPSAGVRVSYTGSYIYALEDAATVRRDITRYIVLALAGVLLVFYAGYRSLRVLPFVTYPMIVSTLVTFALSLLLFAQLNAVSISFAAILYGLSIDSGIYFYTRFAQERRRLGAREAVTATLAGLGRANVASSATTAAVFAVIGLSRLNAVRQLGVLTAIGMLLTIVEFFTLYPALALAFGRSRSGALDVLDTPRLGRLAGRFASAPRATALAGLVLGTVLLWVASHVGIDVSLPHLRPKGSEAVRVEEEIASRFGRLASGGAVFVRRPDAEQALVAGEAVTARLIAYQQEGLLQSVASVTGVLPSARVQQARLAEFNRLPRDAAVKTFRAALARHGFVPERFDDFLADFLRPREEVVTFGHPALAPLSLLIDRYVRHAGDAYVVATYVEPAQNVSFRSVADRLHADLGGTPFGFASRLLLEEELGGVVREEFILFLALALLGNVVILLATFRRVPVALAVLVPSVLAVLAVFAVMDAWAIAVDPVNLVVVPLILGLGVDYGVYVTVWTLQWGDARLALQYGGRALVVTALTTTTGFGFLGLSRYPPLSSMGLLCGLGLTFSVLLSLTVLPALLTLAGVRPRPTPLD